LVFGGIFRGFPGVPETPNILACHEWGSNYRSGITSDYTNLWNNRLSFVWQNKYILNKWVKGNVQGNWKHRECIENHMKIEIL